MVAQIVSYQPAAYRMRHEGETVQRQGPVDVPLSSLVQEPANDGVTIHDDGSVEISAPYVRRKLPDAGRKFDVNIADGMDEADLSRLSTMLLEGIEADITSRSEMVGEYARGIDLLGLKPTERQSQGGRRRRTSSVRHPLLLQAVVDFQSKASAELMPANGPVKVVDRNSMGDPGNRALLADALQNDMNSYLVDIASEYYPDFDRGLFFLGYGGTIFRKPYHCPLRGRPVTETVHLTDLIVSEDANDLESAMRVTHRIDMTPATFRRMQLAGMYRDIVIVPPAPPERDEAQRKIAATQGLQAVSLMRPEDMEREIYEASVQIDPREYGWNEAGAPSDLPLPLRVSIDRASRTVLEIRRNWRKGDKLHMPRPRFVKYELIPGLGFLGYGFLHLLGNTTRAMTAAWRIMIDAGMLANFPAGLRVKGTRQSNNELTAGPGEFPEIDTGPIQDIRAAVMPFPFKGPDQVFLQFTEVIKSTMQGLGMAVNLEVGEGRSNTPVGTIMAMIEQQTQTMSAVHKRLHRAQKRELQMIRELFIEDPNALQRYSDSPAHLWQMAEEFNDLNLVPASDPNVPSRMHRIMVAAAVKQLAASSPNFNQRAVDEWLLKTLGLTDGASLMNPAGQQPPTDPKVLADAARIKLQSEAQAQKTQAELEGNRIKAAAIVQKAQSDERQAQLEHADLLARNAQADEDRAGRERIALIKENIEKIKAGANLHGKLAGLAAKEQSRTPSGD